MCVRARRVTNDLSRSAEQRRDWPRPGERGRIVGSNRAAAMHRFERAHRLAVSLVSPVRRSGLRPLSFLRRRRRESRRRARVLHFSKIRALPATRWSPDTARACVSLSHRGPPTNPRARFATRWTRRCPRDTWIPSWTRAWQVLSRCELYVRTVSPAREQRMCFAWTCPPVLSSSVFDRWLTSDRIDDECNSTTPRNGKFRSLNADSATYVPNNATNLYVGARACRVAACDLKFPPHEIRP